MHFATVLLSGHSGNKSPPFGRQRICRIQQGPPFGERARLSWRAPLLRVDNFSKRILDETDRSDQGDALAQNSRFLKENRSGRASLLTMDNFSKRILEEKVPCSEWTISQRESLRKRCLAQNGLLLKENPRGKGALLRMDNFLKRILKETDRSEQGSPLAQN